MNNNKYFALILAGGSGQRFKTSQPKQLFELNNLPIFIYSIKTFITTSLFNKIILVYSRKEKHLYEEWLIKEKLIDKIELVEGGSSRIDSTFNGLLYLKSFSNDDDFVLIHDSARPFIKQDDIISVIEELKNTCAVTLGNPISDTIKKTDNDGIILSNIPRENLWSIQTPQGFHYSCIYNSHKKLRENLALNSNLTDDTEIVRLYGYEAKVIKGDKQNIKITYVEDIGLI